jgi:predicted peroxiredoxin
MSKKDGIIFLDFDGVLVIRLDDFTGDVVSEEAVYYLNKLCLETGYKIVVCSSWRHLENYKDILYNSGIDPKIEVVGKTELNKNGREAEIKDYVREHNIEKYIVIDDAYLSDDFESHHVRPASRLGFTKNKYDEALKKISEL